MKVYSEYRIENGELRARGKEIVREYDPLEQPEMVDHLTRLREDDYIPTLEFARTWGLLGWWVFDASRKNVYPREEVDSVRWIWNMAKHVRDTLSLYEHVVSGNKKAIVDQLAATVTHLKAAPTPLAEDDATAEAERSIAQSVNPFLGPVFEGVRYTLETSPLRLELEAPVLLSAIFWHVAKIVTTETKVARCEECDRVFVLTHGHQRYCPPISSWRKPSSGGSQCGARARKRRQRQGSEPS